MLSETSPAPVRSRRLNERPLRRFSEAISEGDGISVVAEVASPADAEAAAAAGAAALIVRADAGAIRDRNDLPLLAAVDADAGDAVVLPSTAWDDEELERRYRDVVSGGRECVVEVRDEEQLERVLELLDPEILLLASDEHADEKLDAVLDLLPDVPAGKLVVADVGTTDAAGVDGLERVGVDAVIVAARDVAALVGDGPRAA